MLGYALLVAALIVGLASSGNPARVAGFFLQGLLARGTLELLAVVTLVEMLTVFLETTGSLQRMLAALRRVFRDARVLIALVPSVLGLFPVPGGVMLSAPMVARYGDEIGFAPDAKASVNLFFRHIWDQVFPFKPHLILAAVVLDIPLFTLIGWQLPVTLASFAIGYWYLVGRHPRAERSGEEAGHDPPAGRPLLIEVAPLVIPLALALGFGIDFVYSVAAGLAFGVLTQGLSRGMLHKMATKGVRPKLLFTLAAVMILKTVVEQGGVAKALAALLAGYGLPIAPLAFALPAVVGLVTGLETAVVAITFPLLLGMIPSGVPVLPYVLVMMIGNAVGSTLSPVHVCMVAGNEYYGARLGQVVRIHLAPQSFRVAGTVAFAWALMRYLGG